MIGDEFIAHWRDIEGKDDSHYEGSDELQGISASYCRKFGLMRIGVHHERLMPGRRVSWPHAEADEEEFVFVLEGEPDLWLDGELRRLKAGEGVAFLPGTGISHTIINNTDKDVRLLVVGEASRRGAASTIRCIQSATRKSGAPLDRSAQRELGPHDGLPDAQRNPRCKFYAIFRL